MKEYLTKNNALLVVGILMIIALGIFGYIHYTKKPTYVDNKEFTESSSSKTKSTIDVYFFHVDWCPHCKKALPVWKQLQNEMPSINGRRIIYHDVNCETDTHLADKFEVSGYPTIKMVSNKKVVEYDAKPELNTLKQFIRTAA